MPRLEIVGVYEIEAPELCHLVEVILHDPDNGINFSEITQECPGQPRANWQVPWDERMLSDSDKVIRAVFYFHFLDVRRVLETPYGPVALPAPSAVPAYLRHIQYEPP